MILLIKKEDVCMIKLKLRRSPVWTKEYLDFINNNKLAYGIDDFNTKYVEELENIKNDNPTIMFNEETKEDLEISEKKFYDVFYHETLVGMLEIYIRYDSTSEIVVGIFDEYSGKGFCEKCILEYFNTDDGKLYDTIALVSTDNPNKDVMHRILTKLGFKIINEDCTIDYLRYRVN